MSFISRFRQAWANRRRNPFTDQELSVDKAENGLIIPSAAPYAVQLVELPRKDTPSTVTVYNVTNSVWMTETASSPGQNEFRVDYPEPDGEGTGLVEFSSLDAGKEVNVTYKATGSPIVTEFIDTLMSHPLNEAAGDMYYHDGSDVARLPNALNTTTKKIKADVLSPVDTESTDETKDKVISNALAKGWEEVRTAVRAVVERVIGTKVHIDNLTERSTASLTMVKVKEIKVNEATPGTLTVEWGMYSGTEGQTVESQLYINGTAVGSVFSTNSVEGINCAVEVVRDFMVDDLIQIYAQRVGSASCYVKEMSLRYSWAINQIFDYELATPLLTLDTTAFSTTNQDPA